MTTLPPAAGIVALEGVGDVAQREVVALELAGLKVTVSLQVTAEVLHVGHPRAAALTAVMERWRDTKPSLFPNYAAGSQGPVTADELLRADGQVWRPI